MGNAPKKKTATSAKAWKGKIEVAGRPLDLPSDNVALVRQISPQAFLSSGLIPDPLQPIVQEAIHTKKGLPPKKQQEIMDKPELVAGAMEMFDRAICYVIIEPEITMPPACAECGEYANTPQHQAGEAFKHAYAEGERDPDVFYADQVDMTDKQFIFQWALGGTADLKSFREQLEGTVGSVPKRQAVPSKAKRTA